MCLCVWCLFCVPLQLIDFGIARRVDANGQSNVRASTPSYQAPEVRIESRISL
jgi:serine/threonine protein kinase